MIKMIKEFQKKLKEKNIKYYIIQTNDDHSSEVVCEHYQGRAFLSGFDGSAGTLVIGQETAYLWTDGRYFIQAAKQLDQDIHLMKQGQMGVPTIKDFLVSHLNDQDVVGFDAVSTSCQFVMDIYNEVNIQVYTEDLLDEFWAERPAMPCSKAYVYDIQFCGESTESKLNRLKDEMAKREIDNHIITTLDDIAWLFNIRGADTPNSPTVLGFAIITQKAVSLYLQDNAYSDELVQHYKAINVDIKDYSMIYEDASILTGTTLVDLTQINYALYHSLQTEVIDAINPTQFYKSIKNEIEIENTTQAHIKDGVAIVKFMYWLKASYGKMDLDEIMISEILKTYREEQRLFVDESFGTICGWKQNGALMHYHATPENYSKITQNGFLLIDSGGQYLDGTTDITRTFALGDLTSKEKEHFTLVLKGMLALQNASFLYGATGVNLDILARQPLWNVCIDYQCGTGHGVGHFLNVHEGPQGIRPRARVKGEETILEPGMILTNEPGVYLEGQYGIRIENELIVQKSQLNDYGQFLNFKTLTLAPIDLDAIDVNLLTSQDKEWLNEYHKEVYSTLSPYLSTDEKTFLKYYTRKV